jgi:hypothetical protein
LDAGFDAGLDAGFDAGLDAGFDRGFAQQQQQSSSTKTQPQHPTIHKNKYVSTFFVVVAFFVGAFLVAAAFALAAGVLPVTAYFGIINNPPNTTSRTQYTPFWQRPSLLELMSSWSSSSRLWPCPRVPSWVPPLSPSSS